MGKFFKARLKSFGFAFEGIKLLFANEGNAQVHLVAAVMVIIAGIFFKISQGEWFAVLLCIGMVVSAEAINTSIEKLADKISPERDNLIKMAKDLAAGAVLILAIISIVIAGIIFLPKIINDIC